jgi:hypothetical protein
VGTGLGVFDYGDVFDYLYDEMVGALIYNLSQTFEINIKIQHTQYVIKE